MAQIAKLTAALEQFYAQAREAQSVADGATAQYLQSLLDQVQGNLGKLTEEYAKASSALDEQVVQAKQAAAEGLQKAKAVRAQAAAAAETAKKPKAPPAEAPPEPIDPQLAQKLRWELLQRFGKDGEAPDKGTESADLWQGLKDWQESSEK
jgi:hypothetical protein